MFPFFRGRCRCLLVAAVFALFSEFVMASEPLLWFVEGRPSAEAKMAVEILGGAAREGLIPADYDADTLRQAVSLAVSGVVPDEPTLEKLDNRLTRAMRRYLRDLHSGRIDPREINENYAAIYPQPFDPDAYLRVALREHRLPEAVAEAVPPIALYAKLREALAYYRKLGEHPAWADPLPAYPGRKLEPGQPYTGVKVLRERLAALGDLPVEASEPERYEGAVVEAVKGFQERHGLKVDGVIGRATLAELNVPPTARVRQIELSLERLRWTPLLQARRMVVVNVPEFMLRAYSIVNGKIVLDAMMKVIVGKALNTRTPLFAEDMRYIEFSPYWNVPRSIARKELVPKLRRTPGYFDEQGFEFVATDGSVQTELTAGNLDALLRGQLRIRQRPGPKNVLGDIKFVFPNNDHIFLHHTSTPKLFDDVRRDFSHGCIRVEAPVQLAKFVLKGEVGWDEERIRQAMGQGKSATVTLREPVRVLIAYSTAVVREDGRVYFFPDVYGHDRLLDEGLRHRRP